MFEDSRTKVIVCNVTNGNAASFAALPNGSAAFYTEPQTFTESAIAATPTTLAYRNGKGVLSFVRGLTSSTIKNGGYAVYAARTEQVSYLGYNGTSGSMDAANSTYYGLKLDLDHTFGMLNNSPLRVTIPYKSDSSATQYEVANGLAVAGTAIFKRQAFKPLKIEKINSGAQKNACGTATASVVNGGTQVVFSEDMTAICTDGEIVRFGATGAGVAPCYKIVSNDGGAAAARIYTLDQAYQGATDATFAAATIETVTEGDWGLKFTGISPTDTEFNYLTDEPMVVSFTLDASDFTTATVTNSTLPSIGSGTYQLVAAMEVRSQFEDKTRELSRYPQTSFTVDASTSNTYRIFAFEVHLQNYVSPTTGIAPISKQRVVIAQKVSLTEAFHTVLGFGA